MSLDFLDFLEIKEINPSSKMAHLARMMGLEHRYFVKPDGWTDEHVSEVNSEIIDQFTKEVKKAGFKVQPYDGRFLYKGVAATTNEKIDGRSFIAIIRATNVRVNYESCGLNKIIYPVLIQDIEYDDVVAARRIEVELENS